MADSSRPVVLVVEPLADAPLAWLREHAEVHVGSIDDLAVTHGPVAAGLLIRTETTIDTRLLDRLPALKVVGRGGVGLDHVDVDACRARGVDVVHTPDANTQAVVEYVFRLLLGALRPVVRLDAPLALDEWRFLRARTVGARQLGDLTVGVLGFGRIGRRIARAASGFGAAVQYHDLVEIPEADRMGATPVDAETLFRTSDVLTVHVDGRSSNRGWINADRLAWLKSEVIFINAARGFVVDADALADAMRMRPDARAILDVHDPEPIASDSPLLGRPNVDLYPHLASRTRASVEAMSWVVRDVIAVLRGESPRWPAPTPATPTKR